MAIFIKKVKSYYYITKYNYKASVKRKEKIQLFIQNRKENNNKQKKNNEIILWLF